MKCKKRKRLHWSFKSSRDNISNVSSCQTPWKGLFPGAKKPISETTCSLKLSHICMCYQTTFGCFQAFYALKQTNIFYAIYCNYKIKNNIFQCFLIKSKKLSADGTIHLFFRFCLLLSNHVKITKTQAISDCIIKKPERLSVSFFRFGSGSF